MLLKNILLILASAPVFVYVISSQYYSSGSNQLIDVDRTVEKKSIYEDQEFLVTLRVKNRSALPVEHLEIIDPVPEDLLITSGSNHVIHFLQAKEEVYSEWKLKSQAFGEFELGPIYLKTSDFQGTENSFKIFQKTTRVVVMPKISYLPKMKIKPRTTRTWPGEIISRRRGNGLDFYGIAEYYPDNPAKRINWKVSSKFEDELFVNQFMSELGGDILVIVDMRSVENIGKPPNSTSTYCVRAAAMISYRLLRDRNRVGLIIVGTSATRVRPGFGKRQFDKILVLLSTNKPGGFWEIRMIGKYLSNFYSRNVTIIFISPLVENSAIEAIIDIVTRGYKVIVISPSPIEAERLSSKYDLKSDKAELNIAMRLAALKRESRLSQLRLTLPVIDWQLSTPFGTELSRIALRERIHERMEII
jgi:uncharacterized protein (DUF58 family)